MCALVAKSGVVFGKKFSLSMDVKKVMQFTGLLAYLARFRVYFFLKMPK